MLHLIIAFWLFFRFLGLFGTKVKRKYSHKSGRGFAFLLSSPLLSQRKKMEGICGHEQLLPQHSKISLRRLFCKRR